jgi:hypothetical protein
VTPDKVFQDMRYLLELLEPSERNQTKFLQLQSVLDYNNVTVEAVMKRVSSTSTAAGVGREPSTYLSYANIKLCSQTVINSPANFC